MSAASADTHTYASLGEIQRNTREDLKSFEKPEAHCLLLTQSSDLVSWNFDRSPPLAHNIHLSKQKRSDSNVCLIVSDV
jgi:hypothetical protein